MSFTTILSTIDSFIWGPPLLILLSGTGLYLTLRLGFIQIRYLPRALGYLFKKEHGGKGDVSSFAALSTALAATIGTGNIVGVATAVQAGGPGALFWMWLVALLGMATKYAECLLAVKYRVKDRRGFMSGGPMYYIERGLGMKWLAKLFAVFGVLVAFFGIGTFPQVNAITHALEDTFNIPVIITAIVVTTLVAMIILGGVKRIATASSIIVPFMAISYVSVSIVIILLNWDKVPDALSLIIHSAFNPQSALGGALGFTVMKAIQSGVARGIFRTRRRHSNQLRLRARTGLKHRRHHRHHRLTLLRLHHHPRLVLLRRTLLRLFSRHPRHPLIPPVIYRLSRHRLILKARHHLDPRRHRKRPHGIPKSNRPHRLTQSHH